MHKSEHGEKSSVVRSSAWSEVGSRSGVIARRGPQKTRRGPKVQRGPNFKFNFRPRSALHHAQLAYIQCTCNSNKIENVKLLTLEL